MLSRVWKPQGCAGGPNLGPAIFSGVVAVVVVVVGVAVVVVVVVVG